MSSKTKNNTTTSTANDFLAGLANLEPPKKKNWLDDLPLEHREHVLAAIRNKSSGKYKATLAQIAEYFQTNGVPSATFRRMSYLMEQYKMGLLK